MHSEVCVRVRTLGQSGTKVCLGVHTLIDAAQSETLHKVTKRHAFTRPVARASTSQGSSLQITGRLRSQANVLVRLTCSHEPCSACLDATYLFR